MSGDNDSTAATPPSHVVVTTPRGGGKVLGGSGKLAVVKGVGGDAGRGGGAGGGGGELTKAEKEDRINRKMEEIRRKNEAIQKRHKEIEEDKKCAKDKNATLDIKRQSASVANVESQDLASRLGAGTNTGSSSFKAPNPGEKKNKVVQFGPEFDLNNQVDRKKVRPSLYAAGRGKRLAALQGKDIENNPGQQKQQHQQHQKPNQHQTFPDSSSTHPLNPFAESKLEDTVGGVVSVGDDGADGDGGGGDNNNFDKNTNLKRRKSFGKNSEFFGGRKSFEEDSNKNSSPSNWTANNNEGRMSGKGKGNQQSQQQWRNDKFEEVNGNEIAPAVNAPVPGDTDWRRERIAIDNERVKRSKDAGGIWKRAWDTEKSGKTERNAFNTTKDQPQQQQHHQPNHHHQQPQHHHQQPQHHHQQPQHHQQQPQHHQQQPQHQQQQPHWAKKDAPGKKDGAGGSGAEEERVEAEAAEGDVGMEEKILPGQRPSTKNIKGSRIGSGRFINTGDSRPGNKATSPSASSAPSIGESASASSPASASATPFQFKGVDILASRLQPTAFPFIPTQPIMPQPQSIQRPQISSMQQPQQQQQLRGLPQPAFTANFISASTAANRITLPPQFHSSQQQQMQQQIQLQQQSRALHAASVGNAVYSVAAPLYRTPAPLQLNLQAFNALQQRQQQQQQHHHQQQQQQQHRGMPLKAETTFERPSKRLNKIGGDEMAERNSSAHIALKPRRSGGSSRPDSASSSSSHRRAGSRPRPHLQPSPAAKQLSSTMQLVKIEIPDNLQSGWKNSPTSSSSSPNKSLPTSPLTTTTMRSKKVSSPDKSLSPSSSVSSTSLISPPLSPPSVDADAAIPATTNRGRRVEVTQDSLKIQLRLSPAEALRLAAKDLEMSSPSSAAAIKDDRKPAKDSLLRDDLVEKQLPKDSNSSLKTTSKQLNSSSIADDRIELNCSLTSSSAFPTKELRDAVGESGGLALPNLRKSTPSSLDYAKVPLDKRDDCLSGSASPASMKKLSPSFSPRGGSDSPSSVLSPKSKILADIKKQRENRSREDELELDEYNPEDELDELLLRPEDILGEEFSLTSGIEGLCVDDVDEEAKEIEIPESTSVNDKASDFSTVKDISVVENDKDHTNNDVSNDNDDDDDEWEDISHDDSATMEQEQIDEKQKDVASKKPVGNGKLSFLLHDECVAMVGE